MVALDDESVVMDGGSNCVSHSTSNRWYSGGSATRMRHDTEGSVGEVDDEKNRSRAIRGAAVASTSAVDRPHSSSRDETSSISFSSSPLSSAAAMVKRVSTVYVSAAAVSVRAVVSRAGI